MDFQQVEQLLDQLLDQINWEMLSETPTIWLFMNEFIVDQINWELISATRPDPEVYDHYPSVMRELLITVNCISNEVLFRELNEELYHPKRMVKTIEEWCSEPIVAWEK